MGFLDNEKIIQEFKENFERTSVNIKDREEIEFSLLEEASEILGLLKKMKFILKRLYQRDLQEKIVDGLGVKILLAKNIKI
jgi:fructose 1,6-bisphosphatase